MVENNENEGISMIRQCMFCGDPIAECMGYVIPWDAAIMLEGKWDINTMGLPRELCPKDVCNDKWKRQLFEETGDPSFLLNIAGDNINDEAELVEQRKLRQAIDENYEQDRSVFDFFTGEELMTEDPRKTGLKNGLRQLTIEQLQRVIDYPGEMVLDEFNYDQGKFCPLGIALELDKTVKLPTHQKVFDILTHMGYSVYNTRGIEGSFYTTNRLADLLTATKEVLQEKKE